MFRRLSIKSLPELAFATCPAVPAAIWLALGVLLALGPCFWGRGWLASVLLTALPAAVFLRLCTGRRRASCWLFPAGALLAALHVWAPWQTYWRRLPRDEVGAEIKALVVKTSQAGGDLAWLQPGARATARLRAFRLGPDEEWTRCTGKVLLRLPPGAEVAYGSSVRAAGAFSVPEDASCAGAFSYRRYLRAAGIRHVFDARSVTVEAPVRGWRCSFAALYAFRDLCGGRLVSGMSSPESRRVLLAMTLGYRQALSARTRARFLRSGAVHLFAISGLHVGIIASLFLFAMRLLRVPFRSRYRLLPVLLGVYVLMTGAAPSAVRAWVMVSIWCVSRYAFRATVPANVIAVAALALLLGNPLNLARAGFQFSFTIVIVLALGWPWTARVVAVLAEKRVWIPLRLRPSRLTHWLRRRASQLAGASVLGWFGSAGLIAWTNNLLIPAALVVNLAASLLAYWALLLACPKVLVSLTCIGWADSLLAHCMTCLMQGIRVLAELGSRPPGSIAVCRPPGWIVFAYYALLLAALAPRVRSLWRCVAGMGALAALGVMLAFPFSHSPRAVLFSGGDSTAPALVIEGGAYAAPVVLNAGGRDSGRCIAAWLAARGHGTVDSLILTGGRRSLAGGAGPILNAVTVRSLVLPPQPYWSESTAYAGRLQAAAGRRVRVLEYADVAGGRELCFENAGLAFSGRVEAGARSFRLRREAPFHRCEVSVTVGEAGESVVKLRWNGGEEATLNLRPSLHQRIVELPAQAGDGGREGRPGQADLGE